MTVSEEQEPQQSDDGKKDEPSSSAPPPAEAEPKSVTFDAAASDKLQEQQHNPKTFGRKQSSSMDDIKNQIMEMMPLYSFPKQRQRWGDTQLHPHTNWGTYSEI